MKGKNKGKVQYVQEFRKITAIQKLPTLKQGFGDIFFQNKAENSKFLRLKDQPFLTQIDLNYRTNQLCQNQYVQTYVIDNEQKAKKGVYQCIQTLNQQIESYKNWAQQLTKYVQKGLYVYSFKSQKASPPVALTKQMQNFDPLAMQINNDTHKNSKAVKTNKLVEQSVNIPSKLKRFDFSEITDYLITDDFKLQDLDGNVDMAKKEIQNFRQFKNINQINSIEQLKADYDKFEYHTMDIVQQVQRKPKYNQSQHISSFAFKNNSSFAVEQQANTSTKKNNLFALLQLLQSTKTLQQKFKYLSVHKSQLDMNINYFRSLGPPSRNIQAFIKNIILDQEDNNILQPQEQQNPFLRQKVDTCLLHFLQASQLKVDKSTLNFYDIENISMARITSTNAPMCIRSQKITRLQYYKLLKKMQKLYKMQHQDGKTRVHMAITTDEIDEDINNKGMKNQNIQNRLSFPKLVDEINLIRKQAFTLQNKDQQVSFKFINYSLVKDEMSKKMFSLLQQLYRRVCQQLPFKYSILEIGLHVDQVNGLAQNYFQTKKLIWFIMTVLQQIQKGKSVDKNITYLQNKNRKDDQPRVIKYKGQKVIAKDKMGTKNLYYNNPIAASTVKQKSISLNKINYNRNTLNNNKNTLNKSKTPIKNNTINKTPIKNSTTNKIPTKNNTITKTVQRNISRSPLKSTLQNQTQNKNNYSIITPNITPNIYKQTANPYQGSTTKKKTIII